MNTLSIRPANIADVPLLLSLIHELAEAEDFPYGVTVSWEALRASLFDPHPAAEALVGEVDGHPAAFAVFYESFATTTGRRGLHLDDLFVRPQFQGAGHGKALMVHIAGIAVERGCARFEWWAQRGNAAALRFYESIGARQLNELIVHRLQDDDIALLARG
ncbi:GNAT family N-acetyltransferase [Pseudoduganella violaceinigra]|uniref:GNAT family N-acetyltransferase n=1 Tax=Pseudoduganella violaceinigra TaxID=246602 RepID=UPI0005534A02|nr:GNAT family N-acetyltransferase [Pseudoduganella violaceinigra]